MQSPQVVYKGNSALCDRSVKDYAKSGTSEEMRCAMQECLGTERAPLTDHDTDDIGSELYRAGREAAFGFDALGSLSGWSSGMRMPKSCPNCLSTKLLVAIDHREKRNYFCRDCTMCWHFQFGQLHRVDREICPGCDLATTSCFERFEQPVMSLA